MFTGIVTDIGRVERIARAGDTRFRIACGYDTAGIDIGASIACAGVCLTAVALGPGWFEVEASAETLSHTTLGDWAAGTRVNLERALRVGDELGGHIVAGHVDGTARIARIAAEGASVRYSFDAPEALARYIAPKGSVCLDGTSLTVNEVVGASFGVNLIPHTQAATTWRDRAEGDLVNIEIDTLARYVARLAEAPSPALSG